MSRDPDIEPETKNWTWVLERPCPDCGYDARAVETAHIGALTRDIVQRWSQRLAGPDLAERPRRSVWSPLEYACHVRDVFVLFERRLGWMLDRDDPLFEDWDQDLTAVESDYASQDAEVVREELVAAGVRLAEAFDAVEGAQWVRAGRRTDGTGFTIASFGRYFLHDPVHHLWDVS